MSNKTQFQLDLEAVIKKLSDILVDKNNKYGDSALSPIGIFSKLSAKEAILIRCDDKAARLRNNQDGDTEDPMLDLWGYLTLYQIAEYREKNHPDVEPAIKGTYVIGCDFAKPGGDSVGETVIYKTSKSNILEIYRGEVTPIINYTVNDNTLDHIQDGGEQTTLKTEKIGFFNESSPKRQIDIENEKKQAHYDRSRGIFPE